MRRNTDSAQIFIRTHLLYSLRRLVFFGVKLALITGGGKKVQGRGRSGALSSLSSSLLLFLLVGGFPGIGIDGRWGFCSGFWERTRVAHGLVLEGGIILPVGVVAFLCDLELCIFIKRIQGDDYLLLAMVTTSCLLIYLLGEVMRESMLR